MFLVVHYGHWTLAFDNNSVSDTLHITTKPHNHRETKMRLKSIIKANLTVDANQQVIKQQGCKAISFLKQKEGKAKMVRVRNDKGMTWDFSESRIIGILTDTKLADRQGH